MEKITSLERLSYNITLGPGYEGYTALITAVELSDEELQNVCQWNKDRYQRIRVYDTEGLEALITCWEPGQQGPIHNYGYQQGWIKVLKGSLTLEYFGKPSRNPDAYNTRLLKEHEVAYINDGPGFHRFSNQGDKPCVALHFYSDKIKKWQVFDEEKREVVEMPANSDRIIEV